MSHKFEKPTTARVVLPDQFEVEEHYYTKVINANIHPLVSYFFNLKTSQLLTRYKHLNPMVDAEQLEKLLNTAPSYFRWAGADLFYCTNENGNRKMVIVETNSCPSGQKSMPLRDEHDELGGYRRLIERTLKPVVEAQSVVQDGALAVVFDKNDMESVGYARVIADVFQEKVYLVTYYQDDPDPAVRWSDGILSIRLEDHSWREMRCVFRYVTQKPWNRFPAAQTKTLVLNPVVACLAGGRNKLVAAKAYEFFNNSRHDMGVNIRTPETIRDLDKSEVPFWVNSFGGYACVKCPYSNAGQGVYTITSPAELDHFMNTDTGEYDQYIVQSLVGSYNWSSRTREGQLFHVGTVPDKNGRIYVADVRLMIHYDLLMKQWRPLVMYSRRAHEPLPSVLEEGADSWPVLGTNLSYKEADGAWKTDSSRLFIADRRDFNRLGIGIDDLIDGFMQTVMATVAIDDMAKKLVTEEGKFRASLFSSLNKDDVLGEEILSGLEKALENGEKLVEN